MNRDRRSVELLSGPSRRVSVTPRGGATERLPRVIVRAALACVLAVVTSGAAAGCALMRQNGGASEASALAYNGPECKTFYSITNEDEHLATAILCGQGQRLFNDFQIGEHIEKRHNRFDDRHFDHLAAGLMLLTCGELCKDDAHPMEIGVLEWYARRTDPDRMADGMAGWTISPEARSAIIERVRSLQPSLIARAARLDPRRHHLYVEVPNEIREMRAAYFKQYAALYQKLDAELVEVEAIKRAGSYAPEVGAKLAALRGEYLSVCKAADCRFDPFVVEVTQELVRFHVATKNIFEALAENGLFLEKAPYRSTYAESIHIALYLAMKKEAEDFAAYERMQGRGDDEARLTARFGSPPPIRVSPEIAFGGNGYAPDLIGGIDQRQFEAVQGIVREVKPATGGEVEVVFEDDVNILPVSDCENKTRILVGIDSSSGLPVYEAMCTIVRREKVRLKIEPVHLPKEEAAELRPSEQVTAFVRRGLRDGFVLYVRNEEAKMTQFRGHRVDPTIDHPPPFRLRQEEAAKGD